MPRPGLPACELQDTRCWEVSRELRSVNRQGGRLAREMRSEKRGRPPRLLRTWCSPKIEKKRARGVGWCGKPGGGVGRAVSPPNLSPATPKPAIAHKARADFACSCAGGTAAGAPAGGPKSGSRG